MLCWSHGPLTFKSTIISYGNEYLTKQALERERKCMNTFRRIWFGDFFFSFLLLLLLFSFTVCVQCTVISTANPVIYNRLVVIELDITWLDFLLCVPVSLTLTVICAFLSKEAYAFCLTAFCVSSPRFSCNGNFGVFFAFCTNSLIFIRLRF